MAALGGRIGDPAHRWTSPLDIGSMLKPIVRQTAQKIKKNNIIGPRKKFGSVLSSFIKIDQLPVKLKEKEN